MAGDLIPDDEVNKFNPQAIQGLCRAEVMRALAAQGFDKAQRGSHFRPDLLRLGAITGRMGRLGLGNDLPFFNKRQN
ncbi:MAG: hypothetical protein V2A63_02255 [Patescibacteria group bacterium]